jgi:hypothetical protein
VAYHEVELAQLEGQRHCPQDRIAGGADEAPVPLAHAARAARWQGCPGGVAPPAPLGEAIVNPDGSLSIRQEGHLGLITLRLPMRRASGCHRWV